MLVNIAHIRKVNDLREAARRIASAMPRPPQPVPYVRDDRETPLRVGRDDERCEVIWVKGESKYFCKGGWTHTSIGKLGDFARRATLAIYGNSLILPKLSTTRETSFPALTAL
jgi:hypothetical protein